MAEEANFWSGHLCLKTAQTISQVVCDLQDRASVYSCKLNNV